MLEASSDLGASRWTTFWRITIPMSIPGVIAAFVFVFIPTIGEYITPTARRRPQGLPVREHHPELVHPKLRLAARLGGGDLPRRRGCHPDRDLRTLSERRLGDRVNAAVSTGGRRSLWSFYVLLLVFLYALIALLIIFSFNAREFVSFPWEGFTLRWYKGFLGNDVLLDALRTSLYVATMASLLTLVLAIPASIALARRQFFAKGKRPREPRVAPAGHEEAREDSDACPREPQSDERNGGGHAGHLAVSVEDEARTPPRHTGTARRRHRSCLALVRRAVGDVVLMTGSRSAPPWGSSSPLPAASMSHRIGRTRIPAQR